MAAGETDFAELAGRVFAAAAPGPADEVCQVVLDTPVPQLDHVWDYGITEELRGQLRVGQRVRVELKGQSRRMLGYVVGFAPRSEFAGELRPLQEIISPVPLVPEWLLRLARRVADRAGGGVCDVLRVAVPKRYVAAEKRFLRERGEHAGETPEVSSSAAGSSSSGPADVAAPSVPEAAVPSAPGQAAAPQEETAEASTSAAHLAERLLAGERLALAARQGVRRLATGEWVREWAARYAELAAELLAAGRSVTIVVPDFRDLDQVCAALAAAGESRVTRMDSRQPDAARYTGYLTALAGEPRIVVGNRSAVYAPNGPSAALLVWDDGDPLLAEPLAPYVHARDAALVRQSEGGGGLLFGAHSLSLEVQRLLEIGYLADATGERPRVARVLHAEHASPHESTPLRVPDFAARVLREGLASGPVLVQVAGPGYAPHAVCRDCGASMVCPHCEGPLMFPRPRVLSCRACGQRVQRAECAECGGGEVVQLGSGSQRTAEQFAHQFAGVRVVVSDSEHRVQSVDARPALVVATRGAEPLAAGGYRAVVLLDAYTLLSAPTLRAGEDALRFWENAISLARADAPCVLAAGAGPVVQAFLSGQLASWRVAELGARAGLGFPPAVRCVGVRGGAAQVEAAREALAGVAGAVMQGPAPTGEPGVQLLTVRFPYGQGEAVARELRALQVAQAAGAGQWRSLRGKSERAGGRQQGASSRTVNPLALRLHFDELTLFDGR